jgi:hypothetical protein
MVRRRRVRAPAPPQCSIPKVALRAGPELYFNLMGGMADALATCLGQ